MLLIYGRQTARISKFTDNQQGCRSCGALDMEVKVYRDYYHLFYIPVSPVGDKTAGLRCKSCGEPLRSDLIQKKHEADSKTPFYLFSFPILIAGVVLLITYANLNKQKEKAMFVENPEVGDVYQIRRDISKLTTYYFLRLIRINGDTLALYHNTLEYYSFTSKLNDDDYFVKDEEIFFTKKELKQMLERMEINAVERNYDDYEGFNRIR